MGITDYDIRRDAASPPTLAEAEVMHIHGIQHPATKTFLSSRKQRGRELKNWRKACKQLTTLTPLQALTPPMGMWPGSALQVAGLWLPQYLLFVMN